MTFEPHEQQVAIQSAALVASVEERLVNTVDFSWVEASLSEDIALVERGLSQDIAELDAKLSQDIDALDVRMPETPPTIEEANSSGALAPAELESTKTGLRERLAGLPKAIGFAISRLAPPL